MPWEAWTCLGLTLLMVAALAHGRIGPDVLCLSVLALVTGLSLVSPDKFPDAGEAMRGFANEGLLTVALLFVIAAGLRRTGAMNMVVSPLLGRPRTELGAQARLMAPVAGMSAFLNNTTVVAMFIPVVGDWTKRTGIAASKLFIPLSYASILGGVVTLIGTSTNVVVNGLLPADHRFGIFSITPVGLAVCITGIVVLLLLGRWLLPNRKPAISASDDPRQYQVEMDVEPGSPIDGQTIEKAGLRHLPGLYLTEIDRAGNSMTAVGPDEVLRGNDRLLFVGNLDSVVDLRKIRGLVSPDGQTSKLAAPRGQRRLVEAVVSNTSPLAGKTVREGRFRTTYGAVVIAVARNGERIIDRKIGDISLRAGDTLLLEAPLGFTTRQRDNTDFYLVSEVNDSEPTRHEKAWVAFLILAAVVLAAAMNWIPMLGAVLIGAVLMVLTRCCSGTEARRAVDWQIIIVIGASIGIGTALQKSGASAHIANALLDNIGTSSPWLALAAVYLVTTLFTEIITNNAAAVLILPIAMSCANTLGVNVEPFAIAVMIAASASFATPIGYQTHLMVLGPGGYKYADFMRVGLIMNVACGAVAIGVIPLFFPFK